MKEVPEAVCPYNRVIGVLNERNKGGRRGKSVNGAREWRCKEEEEIFLKVSIFRRCTDGFRYVCLL